MKAKIVGSVVVICAVVVTAFILLNLGNNQSIPQNGNGNGNTTQPNGSTPSTLETYDGNLTAGSSYFHNGEALVEMTFEDGRVFTAPEQLAASANMTIGKTYQVTFSSAEPSVAISIQEVS